MADGPPYGLIYNQYGFEPDGAGLKVLARSANLDMAVRELTSYASYQVQGRSCLVAGARGSGKTTLILRACEEVVQNRAGGSRLILVRLHGPSLINPPKPVPTKDDPTPAEMSIAEHVLKTAVINLYQTASEEVANAFAEFVRRGGAEASEFAAQLRLTLDGAPSAATLRFFWDRAGAMPGGVLFPPGELGPYYDPSMNRGAAEIVALASAADAYRSCSGQYKQEKKDAKSAGDKAEATAQVSAAGKDLSHTLIGLASGVAAGAAAKALAMPDATAALFGAIAALASMVTLSYSRTRSRETTAKEEITFLPDTSVSALVHRVILLLRRLRQAGLVPVFVIDELDKVANPLEPLNELTTSLKFLFADQAFFCFLTDRTYFAEIGRQNRERPNTTVRTIYTNQMLVRYDTAAIHEFLNKVIRPSDGAVDPIKSDLEADAEAFRYILICRSRMLLFELTRDLTDFSGRDSDGTAVWLNLAPKAPRENLGHQLHLAVQFAIELVLTNEFVAARISRDPNFAQTIYDALYYPVNLWYADQRQVDCGGDALMRGIGDVTGEPLRLEPPDQSFLHTQVKAVLDLVSDLPRLTDRLREAFRSKRLVVADAIQGRLLDAIPKEIHLLKAATDREDAYQWAYNRSGIPYEASKIWDIQDNSELWNAYAIIDALGASVREIVPQRPTIAAILNAVAGPLGAIELVAGFSVTIRVGD